jgi:hypothetical protein
VIANVGRHGGIADAQGVLVGWVAGRDMADGGLLGVLRIAGVDVGVVFDGAVVKVACRQGRLLHRRRIVRRGTASDGQP